VLLAILCQLLAPLLPQDQVWPYVVHVSLLSASGWLTLLWPVWIGLWAWRTGRWRHGALLGVLALVLAPRPGTHALEAGAHALEDSGWRVLSANVDAYSPDLDRTALAAAFAGHEPDVVFVHENRIDQIPGMVRVADNLEAQVDRESHRSFVFCREGIACEGRVTQEVGSPTMKMPIVILRMPDGLCMLGIHAPPPVPFDITGLDPYVSRVASSIVSGRLVHDLAPCEQHDPVLVVGDLNTVPGSQAHKDLLATGLADAFAGQGPWAATWPNGGGWPKLPVFQLDHVLAGAVDVHRAKTIAIPGSDHKGLWVHIGRALGEPGPKDRRSGTATQGDR